MKLNKFYKNITMGLFAVILLTSTLTLGVQNGINTPITNSATINSEEHHNSNNVNSNDVNSKTKGSQHPIIQIAEAVKEIPNEANFEDYKQEKDYSKQKEPRPQYNSIETTSEYGKVNEVTIKAERLPNGQYAYRMIEHILRDGNFQEDLTNRYLQDGELLPTIPGPSIEINQNDLLIIHSIDENGYQKTQRIEPKEIGTFEYFGDRFRTLGLFGAIIVNPIDKVPAQLDGKVVSVDVNSLDKQFVLFMVGSTFWGQEIDENHHQTPLWTNPHLGADLNQVIRFHILGAAHQHTFHLHAHRWLDPGTTNIIDTKLIQPNTPHWFIVEAGDRVGVGDWQYHCHVFAHMEAGMMGTFTVGEVGSYTESVAGKGPSVVGGQYKDQGQGNFITFDITDEPGQWFRNVGGEVAPYATKSLGIVESEGTVNFIMSSTNTVHTITSLLWPTGAPNMPFDQMTAYRGGGIVQLEKPGLYVFTCKIHPYMFGGVIVDNPNTPEYDLGDKLSLSTGDTLDPNDLTGSGVATALALLKTFFIANNPSNWVDYSSNAPSWNPRFPGYDEDPDDEVDKSVLVRFGEETGNLHDLIYSTFDETDTSLDPGELEIPVEPLQSGVGEVWINTQFEKTAHKSKPGTATRVDAEDWTVERKVALPQINMNNPHNMWSDREQKIIYQTQWFDNLLTAFDREGKLLDNIRIGDAPSHVMTNPKNDKLYVALSGEQGVAEIKFNKDNYKFEMQRIIPLQEAAQLPTHPHAHWITPDGNKMITPNHFTDDTTIIDFYPVREELNTEENEKILDPQIQSRTKTGKMPIATSITPDGQHAYVANLLSSSISVVDMETGELLHDIDLADKKEFGDKIASHALPIQTPVSPDGQYVVTANTLSGNIAIIDTDTNEIVASLPCDPGCHGVNFGAKEGGGYYAYVSSKFSNRLIVVDGDPDNDKDYSDAAIAGSVLLTGYYDDMNKPMFATDDKIVQYDGMGGQGVYAIPNVYPGWVYTLDLTWPLTSEQRDPGNQLEDQPQAIDQQAIDQQAIDQQAIDQQAIDQQAIDQQAIEEIQQQQYQQQLESIQGIQTNDNQILPNLNSENNALMNSMQHVQQQTIQTPETFADKIAKQRQQLLNPDISSDSQLMTEQEHSLSSSTLEQQESTTSQSIEQKLAEIQQQSIRNAIVPDLIEQNVNPALEKAGNVISMLPVPIP
jgi:DNA-binding beta-propeller fold protein YncE/plastocyanin